MGDFYGWIGLKFASRAPLEADDGTDIPALSGVLFLYPEGFQGIDTSELALVIHNGSL